MVEKVHTFISYSHKDRDLKDLFVSHLFTLIRTEGIELWTDDYLTGGEEWRQSINNAMRSADLVLLLISPNFIMSEYCYNQELKEAILMHQNRKAIVVPVGLTEVDITDTPFSELQMLPSNPTFVNKWKDPNSAFVDVIENLRKTLSTLVIELKNWNPVARKEDIRRLIEMNNYEGACNRLFDFVEDFSKNDRLKYAASDVISDYNFIKNTILPQMDKNSREYLKYVTAYRKEIKPLKDKIFELLDNVFHELKALAA